MNESDKLLATCLSEIAGCNDTKKLEAIKNLVFGKNGRITEMMKNLKTLSVEEKKVRGAEINRVKTAVLESLKNKSDELELKELEKKLAAEKIDVSMPARPFEFGNIHPLTKVAEEVSEILSLYGFSFADGPEIENEYYNFTALNMPDHHPARTMHDTFYINETADDFGRKLLRTHTSPVEIRTMHTRKPPFRMFSIGRTFRSDYDATHTPMFTQIEGLIIDKDIGFANLKWLLGDFLKKFFGVSKVNMRFRPSFFPFTEPSAEVDIAFHEEDKKLVFGTGDKWLEIVGCGVLHPNVLKAGKTDASKYRGLAFGFGLERLASLKYGVPDLRGYFESGENWRNSFGFHPFSK